MFSWSMFRLRLRSICPERTQNITFSRLNIIPARSGTKLFSIFLAFALPRKMKKGAWDPCVYSSILTVISDPLQFYSTFLVKPQIFWRETACAIVTVSYPVRDNLKSFLIPVSKIWQKNCLVSLSVSHASCSVSVCVIPVYDPRVVHTTELLASFWSGFGHLTLTSS